MHIVKKANYDFEKVKQKSDGFDNYLICIYLIEIIMIIFLIVNEILKKNYSNCEKMKTIIVFKKYWVNSGLFFKH